MGSPPTVSGEMWGGGRSQPASAPPAPWHCLIAMAGSRRHRSETPWLQPHFPPAGCPQTPPHALPPEHAHPRCWAASPGRGRGTGRTPGSSSLHLQARGEHCSGTSPSLRLCVPQPSRASHPMASRGGSPRAVPVPSRCSDLSLATQLTASGSRAGRGPDPPSPFPSSVPTGVSPKPPLGAREPCPHPHPCPHPCTHRHVSAVVVPHTFPYFSPLHCRAGDQGPC